jgi:hypothetical protein
MSASTVRLDDYRGNEPEPLLEPYWPSDLHRFIFRNWPLVWAERLAEVIGATAAQVRDIAASMGLPDQPPISDDQWRRSYITIIRRNWHILPYEQLLQLLDWSETHLAEALKEDDFLWVKLGKCKPKCEPLRYAPPTAEQQQRAAEIRAIIAENFDDPWTQQPRFAFVQHLSEPPVTPRVEMVDMPHPDEVTIGPHWSTNSPRLRAWFRDAFGIELGDRGPSIKLSIDPSRFKRRESHEVVVRPDGIDIIGASDLALRRGERFLERQMQARRGPHLPLGVTRRDAKFDPRFMYAYFALFGDPLSQPEVDPYPDGYLERLADLDVGGVWLQGLLWQLAPSKLFPEFGDGWRMRIDNLNKLIDRAAGHGLEVWMYLNEPRAMSPAFYENHPDIAGVFDPVFGRAMCTSTQPVHQFLVEATEHVFSHAPQLAGAFTITYSESLTNCRSRVYDDPCPRCIERPWADVIAEVNCLIAQGVWRGNPDAKVIVWDWALPDEVAPSMIAQLPDNVIYQCVSEWSLPVTRGGLEGEVGEYSLSAVGPGPRALRHWDIARKRGLQTSAKVQINNTWEYSPSPYMPLALNVARHCANLRDAGVDGLMLSWSLGGSPSPNLQTAQQYYFGDAPTPEQAVRRMCAARYGEAHADAGLAAFTAMTEAMNEYPYHITVVYRAPMHMGAANLLYEQPTGYEATMIGIPYDDLASWRGPYSPDVFIEQFDKTARLLDIAIDRFAAIGSVADDDRRMAEVMRVSFASCANQARFVVAREAGDRDEMRRIATAEIDLAVEQHRLASEDSRIGFEATNQYIYVPIDLVEKVINCRWEILEKICR